MIRSSIFAGLTPDITTLKDQLAPAYTGIYCSTCLTVQTPSSKYNKWSSIKRIFCTCGYEAATMDATFDAYRPVCPHCGGKLIELRGTGGWSRTEDNSLAAEDHSVRINAAGELELTEMKVSIKPHIVTAAPANAHSLPENLKMMELEVSHNPCYTIRKLPSGRMVASESPGAPGPFRVYAFDMIKDYLGETTVGIMTSPYRPDEIVFEMDSFEAIQKLSNIFTPENLKTKKDVLGEVVDMYNRTHLGTCDHKAMSPTVNLETFLEKKGYPIALFPTSFVGRNNLKYSRDVYLAFLDTPVGKIVSNRITNGYLFSSTVIDGIVYITMGRKLGVAVPPPVSYYVKLDDPCIAGYEDLFLPFLKDGVDQFNSETLLVTFVQRLRTLREQGMAAPTEETIRTRAFSALNNESRVTSKKSLNISEDLSKSPYETFCSLSKRKQGTN